MLVDQLCQAYHWTFEEAMSRTLPQIIMLNHAASVNAERTKACVAAKYEKQKVMDATDPIVLNGKRISQLTSEELAAYYAQW